MKEAMNLTAIAERLESDRASRQDLIVSTDKLSVAVSDSGAPLMRVSGTDYDVPLNHIALRQLGQHVGIRADYVDRCITQAPDLFAQNVNTWLSLQDATPRMLRLLGDRVRAFLSDGFKRIDNIEVAESLLTLPQIQDGTFKLRSADIGDRKMFLKFTTDKVQREIKSRRVGDIVQSGFSVSNSDVGHGSLSSSPFLEYLWCTNGMTTSYGNQNQFRINHSGAKQGANVDSWIQISAETARLEAQAVLSKIGDIVRSASDESLFNKTIDEIQATTQSGDMVGDIPGGVRVLAQTLDLSQGEESSVLTHLISGNDLSQYGLMNAVTRTAQDVESYERASEIEGLGMNVVRASQDVWSRIANAEPIPA